MVILHTKVAAYLQAVSAQGENHMDSDDHSFYVCLYLEGGKPIGHRFGLSTNFPTKLDDPRPKPNVTTSLNISEFRAILENSSAQ